MIDFSPQNCALCVQNISMPLIGLIPRFKFAQKNQVFVENFDNVDEGHVQKGQT